MTVFRLGLIAFFALTACEEATSSSDNVGQSQTAEIGPGDEPAEGVLASTLFSDVCVKTAPSFKSAPQVLQALPFQQHPETGTYYHQDLNFSVKLHEINDTRTCSMVFASPDEKDQLALLFSLSVAANTGKPNVSVDPNTATSSTDGPGGTKFTFFPAGKAGGLQYFRAALTASD
jgi:hypothetical protein